MNTAGDKLIESITTYLYCFLYHFYLDLATTYILYIADGYERDPVYYNYTMWLKFTKCSPQESHSNKVNFMGLDKLIVSE